MRTPPHTIIGERDPSEKCNRAGVRLVVHAGKSPQGHPDPGDARSRGAERADPRGPKGPIPGPEPLQNRRGAACPRQGSMAQ
jgi:hypothetical protein